MMELDQRTIWLSSARKNNEEYVLEVVKKLGIFD